MIRKIEKLNNGIEKEKHSHKKRETQRKNTHIKLKRTQRKRPKKGKKGKTEKRAK